MKTEGDVRMWEGNGLAPLCLSEVQMGCWVQILLWAQRGAEIGKGNQGRKWGGAEERSLPLHLGWGRKNGLISSR